MSYEKGKVLAMVPNYVCMGNEAASQVRAQVRLSP